MEVGVSSREIRRRARLGRGASWGFFETPTHRWRCAIIVDAVAFAVVGRFWCRAIVPRSVQSSFRALGDRHVTMKRRHGTNRNRSVLESVVIWQQANKKRMNAFGRKGLSFLTVCPWADTERPRRCDIARSNGQGLVRAQGKAVSYCWCWCRWWRRVKADGAHTREIDLSRR